MKKYSFAIQEPYKSYVINGKKTVEGRLYKGKFQSIEVGDILYFESKEEFIVTGKKLYTSFSDMLQNEGIKNIIPDKASLWEAVDVYYKFYTPKQEKELGVVAIEIQKL